MPDGQEMTEQYRRGGILRSALRFVIPPVCTYILLSFLLFINVVFQRYLTFCIHKSTTAPFKLPANCLRFRKQNLYDNPKAQHSIDWPVCPYRILNFTGLFKIVSVQSPRLNLRLGFGTFAFRANGRRGELKHARGKIVKNAIQSHKKDKRENHYCLPGN